MTWLGKFHVAPFPLPSNPTMKKEALGQFRSTKCTAFKTPSHCLKKNPELWSCVASSSEHNFSVFHHPSSSQLCRNKKNNTRFVGLHQQWNKSPPLVGVLSSHLVFRRLSSLSESLTTSLTADSPLDSDFSKSESAESSLSTEMQIKKQNVNLSSNSFFKYFNLK